MGPTSRDFDLVGLVCDLGRGVFRAAQAVGEDS